MKIGIVTWFHYKNYGTVLQAYSLRKFLENKGYDCRLINYIPVSNENLWEKFLNGNVKKGIERRIENHHFNSLPLSIREDITERNKRFEKFIEKNIKLTKLIEKDADLQKLNKDIDCFICGSDQIWNPENLNNIYFLNFVNDKNKKISYAPSFGVSELPRNKKENIREWINRFDRISIREEKGHDILKSLTQKDVQVVVDPTLLLSKKNWEELLINPNINEDYILCYFLGDREEYWNQLKRIKNLTGYKVIIIPIKFNSYLQDGELRTSTSPSEFVGLIKNAKLVLTDSFHGTIFSLKFEKDFYVFKRFKDTNKGSQNSRIYNILKLVNLEERLLDDTHIIKSKEDININNYNEVNKILEHKIESSVDFLTKALNESTDGEIRV